MQDVFRTLEKLQKRIDELEKYRYRDEIILEKFQVQEEQSGLVNPEVPTEFSGWETMRIGDHWSGRDRYLWLHTDITIPAEWIGKKVVGRFDFGRTRGGNNSGFESLLYVNGEMYQGVDANHKEVFFTPEICRTKINLTFRLWSGLEGGGIPREQEHKLDHASVSWLDEYADDLYYLGKMVLETAKILSEADPVRYDLIRALDQAFLCLDWSRPGSAGFYESILEADEMLNEKIDGMEKQAKVTVYCVGHTHIDLAWLWRLKHTKEKGSRSFSTVLRLMELYPEYQFLQTQPQIYAYMKEEFPELYKNIKKRVAEGRWEADGAMWVEADCNLTSGESLVRQILLGSRFLKEEFGHEPEYLWLPDVFGYSWALPQILKKAGIEMFMTTKISWNEYNRMPHDTFWWKGIDGSKVLTHFITTPEMGKPDTPWFYTYNGLLTPNTVEGVWKGYRDKDWNRELLISYGYGDGGGGVNRDMLEQRRRMDRIPGLPAVKTSSAGEYFRKLRETADHADSYIHTWDGELYLEFHRGTYTSHAYNKKMNRKMELLYREAEIFSVFKGILEENLCGADQEKLTKGWQHLLTDQFHDIIPGSSIREVYEDSKKDYEYIENNALEVEEEFFGKFSEKQEGIWTVWNTSAWDMDGVVFVEQENDGYFVDENGSILYSQKEGVGYQVLVNAVPAMGKRQIAFHEIKGKSSAELSKADGGEIQFGIMNRIEETPFSITDRTIETPFYILALNESGQICRLYDKEYEREVLAEGECANVLQVFEDKPTKYDAWNIDIFYTQKMRTITDLARMEIEKPGKISVNVNLEWNYGDSRICQKMVLYAHSRRIDFVTTVDYHEPNQLLKAAFPVDIRSTYATYDVQYGNVRRPNHWNTDWDLARFESVAHRWVDLSERDYGVSLLNDCKYGHDVKDNVMRITLIKAATHPDYVQDIGMHEFTYSLLPHGGDFVSGRVVQEAYDLNQPMKITEGTVDLPWKQFLRFSTDQVELDAVKKSEDGRAVIVRFYEFTGSRCKVQIDVAKSGIREEEADAKERMNLTDRDIREEEVDVREQMNHLTVGDIRWKEVDLRERILPDGASGEGDICLKVRPYEIKTVALWLE